MDLSNGLQKRWFLRRHAAPSRGFESISRLVYRAAVPARAPKARCQRARERERAKRGRFCRRQFERRRIGRKRHDHWFVHEQYDNRELNDWWREQ
jgi:hypothetical protein